MFPEKDEDADEGAEPLDDEELDQQIEAKGLKKRDR